MSSCLVLVHRGTLSKIKNECPIHSEPMGNFVQARQSVCKAAVVLETNFFDSGRSVDVEDEAILLTVCADER